MAHDPDGTHDRNLERLDWETLAERLRQAARDLTPDRVVDDLELRHLMRVVTGCSLLLTDVYSDERIARIMQPERTLPHLVMSLLEEERHGGGEILYRIRRLPDDVRVVGDKALFDLGMLGTRRIKGYDLGELGPRAYRMAGEALRLLAEDRRLRDFFRQNKLLMLPLEEEVTFLRQCSERFPQYAEILRHMQQLPVTAADRAVPDLASRIPLMAAVAEVIAGDRAEETGAGAVTDAPAGDPYRDAARGDGGADALLSRDGLLSVYERMVLFSSLDMDRLKSALDSVVIDQRGAVDALCDEFSLFASGTRDLRKPPAYFLVGPTGVGKNHLVESLCRLLEGLWQVEVPVLTIEGPNYTYPSDINELRGATRGFIRSDEEGLLGSFHERSSRAPLAVILVDEVEKAHAHLRQFFLSILDRGTVTDNRGRVLNFSNCMIFFTSNLGYSDAQRRSAPIGYMDEAGRLDASDKDVKNDLRRALSPEFMNRVRLIHFERLSRASAERILDLELGRIERRYRDVHGLGFRLDQAARDELLRRGFSPLYGARPLASTLEAVCNVEIARKLRRDDRRVPGDRQAMVAWLRDLKAGSRAFDPNEVRRRVLEMVRADVGYDALCIGFDGVAFTYDAARGEDG